MFSAEVARSYQVSEPSDREMWWRQYAMWVDLYKEYLRMVLRLNIFFYAITGAILSYFLAHSDDGLARLALLFPAIMSFAFWYAFSHAAVLIVPMRNNVIEICGLLRLAVYPEVGVLDGVLKIFGRLMLIVAAALTILALWPALRPGLAQLLMPPSSP